MDAYYWQDEPSNYPDYEDREAGMAKAAVNRRLAREWAAMGDRVRSYGLDATPYYKAAGRFEDNAELLEEQWA